MSIPKSVAVYIGYSRKDEEWCQRLLLQLQPLKRLGLINIRHDEEIRTGTDWREYYESAFNEAAIAILLVSPNFLNSDFIVDVEVPPLLERHHKGEITIMPVIVRPCVWTVMGWFNNILVSPRSAQPLSVLREADMEMELFNVAMDVYRKVQELTSDPNFLS
jgi:hypothetical protein